MYRAIFYRGDIMAQHPPVLRYNRVELTPYFTEHFGNRWLLYYASDTPEPTSPDWGKDQLALQGYTLVRRGRIEDRSIEVIVERTGAV